MKIPEKAPNLKALFSELHNTLGADKAKELIKKANNEYMYWDDLKHQPMPEGIKPETVWALLKLSRYVSIRQIALSDSQGRPFGYWLPDCVLREVHFIDQQAGGSMLVDDPSVHSEEKKRYMVRSLVEEAISSSQIEGAVTTRVVAKEMLETGRKPKDRSEQMIFNNYLSMQMIKQILREPLSPKLIQQVHASMTKDTLEDSSWERRFRTPADDAIHIFDVDGQTVLHVPPRAADVPLLMQELCTFINSDKEEEFVNPVVKGILLHFWLAYVHPFMDGNGRTARALFYWYMLKHGYWLFEYLSVSTAILSARIQYYRSFLYAETDDNDATYFIVYNLRAIHRAIKELNAYIERKQKEKRQANRFAIQFPALNLRQRTLLASALEKPDEIFTIEVHSNIHDITYQTARTDLLGLRDMGLLGMRKVGRKFVFTAVADLKKKLEG